MQFKNDLYTGRTLEHYIFYYVQERVFHLYFLSTFEVQNGLKVSNGDYLSIEKCILLNQG